MVPALARLALVIACASQIGCTFYTACPNGTTNNQPTGTGGGSGAGGGGSGAGGGAIVGTVPQGQWQNITANLADQPSECGNLADVISKPNEDVLITGVALLPGGTAGDTNVPVWWASRDGGVSWTPLAQGQGSDVVVNRPTYLLFDRDNPDTFWVVGIHGDFGVYETADSGQTFKVRGSLRHNDFVSVDFSDANRQTLLVSAHEQGHVLYRSTNGGADWTDIGGNLDPDTNPCDYPWVVDSRTFLFGCSQFGGGPSGIFRSSDAGDSWQPVGDFAGTLSQPVRASDDALYWMTTSGLARSDTGGADWQTVAQGLSSPRVIELPDKRLAALASYVVVSADRGLTWKPVTSAPPFVAEGLTYSPFQKAFVVWHSTCAATVPSDAIMRYDFDYETE